MNVVAAVQQSSGYGFPHVITALSEKSVDLLFHVLSLHT